MIHGQNRKSQRKIPQNPQTAKDNSPKKHPEPYRKQKKNGESPYFIPDAKHGAVITYMKTLRRYDNGPGKEPPPEVKQLIDFFAGRNGGSR